MLNIKVWIIRKLANVFLVSCFFDQRVWKVHSFILRFEGCCGMGAVEFVQYARSAGLEKRVNAWELGF